MCMRILRRQNRRKKISDDEIWGKQPRQLRMNGLMAGFTHEWTTLEQSWTPCTTGRNWLILFSPLPHSPHPLLLLLLQYFSFLPTGRTPDATLLIATHTHKQNFTHAIRKRALKQAHTLVHIHTHTRTHKTHGQAYTHAFKTYTQTHKHIARHKQAQLTNIHTHIYTHSHKYLMH